jgi:SAM-dependent methyltransferase
MWLPKFACPECREAIPASGSSVADGAAGLVCSGCGARFTRANGVYRFLSVRRAEAAEPFQRQYRLVRQREGYRLASPDYYRRLPMVSPDDPHATEWRIRRESLAHLQRHVLPAVRRAPIHVLDLGAGSGWLSHRLAADGHRAVAVDRLDDETDGLGACRHYPVPFAAVQADFDALPFEPFQFDLVVFDGSLHYAPDPATTLTAATRMLTPGGAIAVMDSPMFSSDGDGQAMVAQQLQRLEIDHGLPKAVRPGVGFLTFDTLEAVGRRLGLRPRFLRSRGPLTWWIGRQVARLTLRRAPAAFGVWVAQ